MNCSAWRWPPSLQACQKLLDRVSEHDRRAADRLVREQLGGELTQTYRTLKSAREKVYTQGHEQTALALGQTLKAIEALQKNIATPAEGAPAYLTQQRISLSELATRYKIHPTQIAQWKRHLIAHAPQVFERGGSGSGTDAEGLTAPLYQEIGRLKMELDFLQKKH